MYKLLYSKQAQKDAKKLSPSNLKKKAICILEMLEVDPFQNPPPFERLIGDLQDAISRRINIQHRIIYQVLENRKIVRILRMWTHYE
jgi:toxin YoeB